MKVIVFEWCFEGWTGRTVKIKFIFPLFAYLFFSICLALKSLSQCLREPMFDLPLCILCKPRFWKVKKMLCVSSFIAIPSSISYYI